MAKHVETSLTNRDTANVLRSCTMDWPGSGISGLALKTLVHDRRRTPPAVHLVYRPANALNQVRSEAVKQS